MYKYRLCLIGVCYGFAVFFLIINQLTIIQMQTNYSDLPRKIKKGLKRKLFKDLKVWKWKEIKITGIVKCSHSISHNSPDFKGFQITGYSLG